MSVEIVHHRRHIIPERSELVIGHKTIKCSETGCESTFKSQSNLTLHLLKIHKKNVSLAFRHRDQIDYYYCPEEDCLYNRARNIEINKNYFTELKHLKQHFRKVHKEKKFECSNCNKAFPDEITLKRHANVCGQKFYCGICGLSYKSHSSLVYHVKQKGHSFEMTNYNALLVVYDTKNVDESKGKSKIKKVKTHQAIQTEQTKTKTKKRPGVTQTTQTLVQTNKRSKATEILTEQTQKLEAASTQTLPIDISFMFDDPMLTYSDNSSQTSHDLISHFHMETQTDQNTSSLIMETLTDNDPLLFNHMQTQTTNELLEDTFDIHTQTHFDTEFDYYTDYQEFVSTETQTCNPRNNLYANNSSSYTQTSQSIEALNQIDIHTQT